MPHWPGQSSSGYHKIKCTGIAVSQTPFSVLPAQRPAVRALSLSLGPCHFNGTCQPPHLFAGGLSLKSPLVPSTPSFTPVPKLPGRAQQLVRQHPSVAVSPSIPLSGPRPLTPHMGPPRISQIHSVLRALSPSAGEAQLTQVSNSTSLRHRFLSCKWEEPLPIPHRGR